MRSSPGMVVRTVGICLKPEQPQLVDLVRGLERWLTERGIRVMLDPQAAGVTGAAEVPRSDLAAKVDLVIVLGGDGTLLAVARAIGDRPVPVLGVNLGTLGFLAEIASDEMYDALERVLAGGFRIESRMRLDVSVQRGARECGRYRALNDAVLARNAVSRMIDLETFANGVEVTTYHADGVIAATPTGSTAYSLSAGGPLLLPESEAIVLTPISPHTLTQRPLVLPATCAVEICVRDTRGGEVRLTVDGQVGCELGEGDCVRVHRSAHPILLLVSPERNSFEAMRTKLRWGAR
ncbi:MAG: NAD(+)/NADH kinase [Myxococcales bacterium]|nr:NAD(+)/NADH kinase [Myxococcales bacterium]MDH5567509.1 NAD(+)/NADH kinase [Myxococcales bacterium]